MYLEATFQKSNVAPQYMSLLLCNVKIHSTYLGCTSDGNRCPDGNSSCKQNRNSQRYAQNRDATAAENAGFGHSDAYGCWKTKTGSLLLFLAADENAISAALVLQQQ